MADSSESNRSINLPASSPLGRALKDPGSSRTAGSPASQLAGRTAAVPSNGDATQQAAPQADGGPELPVTEATQLSGGSTPSTSNTGAPVASVGSEGAELPAAAPGEGAAAVGAPAGAPAPASGGQTLAGRSGTAPAPARPFPGKTGGGSGAGRGNAGRPGPRKGMSETKGSGEGEEADEEFSSSMGRANQNLASGRPEPAPRPRSVQLDDDELAAALGGVELDHLLKGDKATQIELDARILATVVKIDHDSVFVALSAEQEGVGSLRQFPEPPVVGQRVEVVVARHLPEEGLYEVLIPGGAMSVGDWSDLSEGMVVEARVTGHNTGGLECEVNTIRGFIPLSQVSLYRVEDVSGFVGQKLACVVTEANPRRKNLVLSHRAVLEREKEESRGKLLSELEPGQIREGVIRSVRDFGAFVDLGGVDGLIHVTQLSWERVKHPRDVVEEGQRVKVKVEKIDPETGKISLSYRDLLDNPWHGAESNFPPGSVVKGTVTKCMEFGAFVRLAAGVEGLVHISELAHRRVSRVSQVVKEGDEVEVKILSVDTNNQKLSLSIKQAQAAAAEAQEAAEAAEEPKREPAVARRSGELKGGTNRGTGGDHFGLKW